MSWSQRIAAFLAVFSCAAMFSACSSSPPPRQNRDQPARDPAPATKVQCRSCHDIVPAAQYCSSCGEPLDASLPPGPRTGPAQPAPQPPPVARKPAEGTYILSLNKLGKNNCDFLVTTLRSSGDFLDWINHTANPGRVQYEVKYVGQDIRKSISQAAELSGVRVYVNVDGWRVEVNNAQGE